MTRIGSGVFVDQALHRPIDMHRRHIDEARDAGSSGGTEGTFGQADRRCDCGLRIGRARDLIWRGEMDQTVGAFRELFQIRVPADIVPGPLGDILLAPPGRYPDIRSGF